MGLFDRFRRQASLRPVLEEFAAFFAARLRGVEILDVRDDGVEFSIDGEDVFFAAGDAIRHASGKTSREAREAIYERLMLTYERPSKPGVSWERDSHSLRPRLITAARARELGPTMVTRSFPQRGLVIAFVLDSPESRAYVTPQMLGSLQCSIDVLHMTAIRNLARHANVAARLLPKISDLRPGKLLVSTEEDFYGAERLLVLPQIIGEKARYLAMAPDEDTCLISLAPSGSAEAEPLLESFREIAEGTSYDLMRAPVQITKGRIDAYGRTGL